jgi:hypothetical protein
MTIFRTSGTANRRGLGRADVQVRAFRWGKFLVYNHFAKEGLTDMQPHTAHKPQFELSPALLNTS